jgi:lipoprotein-anchoring transpeptidase ErfK/SrfK
VRFVSRLAIALGAAIALPAAACATVRIDVDLSAQTMRVAADSGESFRWPISSGRAGHLTPRGAFRPTALYPMVHSAKYGNAPMPHSIFFYGQYAIHGTEAVGALGRPASHGCIRLAPANAATLYALVARQGAEIRISGENGGHAAVAARSARRHPATALGNAPHRRVRTLKQWAADPLNNR